MVTPDVRAPQASGVPRNFFLGGGGRGIQQVQLRTVRTEDREDGVLEAAVIWYKKFHFI